MIRSQNEGDVVAPGPPSPDVFQQELVRVSNMVEARTQSDPPQQPEAGPSQRPLKICLESANKLSAIQS